MKLKFCGFRTREDIEKAITCNIDYIGLIFADSKRKIDKYKAAEIIKDIDFGKIKLVGVFMNQSLNEVMEISEYVNLDVIQLHGLESNKYIEEVGIRTKKEIWKAISSDEKNLEQINEIEVETILIDSTKGGGSGKLADWSLIGKYEKQFNKSYFLAGGLRLSNIQDAISCLKPIGLDISSGIEINGIKDLELMKIISRMVKKNG